MRSYEEDFGGFPPEAPCRDEDIEPGSTLVLVADHGTPMHDHRHADGSWRSILDEDFAYDLTESYRRLVNNARERGAREVFTTAPRVLAHPRYPPGHPMQEPRRSAAYNALLGDLVAELGPEGVGLIDTAMWLDASGREGPYPRSDGLHIDFDFTEPFACQGSVGSAQWRRTSSVDAGCGFDGRGVAFPGFGGGWVTVWGVSLFGVGDLLWISSVSRILT